MPPFDPARPYNSLPLLPPSADIETRAILKACIGARSALAELKHIGALIPNQDVLINTIPLREAKDSSEIENVVTTGDRLFRHAGTDAAGADPATRETLRYRTALFEGYRELRTRPLTAATAVTICRTIRGIDVGFRDLPGVALKNPLTGEIIYTPPEGEPHLRDLLANWEAFLHGDSDIDPLIRMAVGHYQFEAIHPFADGNGRTGRILNILYLIERGLLQIPVLYHSAHIVRNRGPYYQLLLEVTKNAAWEAWILYMLAAVAETAQLTTRRIEAINTLMQQTDEHVRSQCPRIHSRELVEIIFTQPYCRIVNLVEAGIAQRQTAAKYLKTLCAIGILEEVASGREKLFLHPRFLRLLMSDDVDIDTDAIAGAEGRR